MNKVLLVGKVCRPPILEYTPQGAPVLRVKVSTIERFRSKDGEDKVVLDYHPVIVWGKAAESLGGVMQEGDIISVEGKMKTRSWGEGEKKKWVTEVVCGAFESKVEILVQRGGGASASPKAAPAPAPAAPATPPRGASFPEGSEDMDSVPF